MGYKAAAALGDFGDGDWRGGWWQA